MNLSPRISYGTFLPYTVEAMKQVEPFVAEKELHRLATSKSLSGKMVFIEDMSDLFGEFIPSEMRNRVLEVLFSRTDVIFQVLTKRPWNAIGIEFPRHVWFGTSIENQEMFIKRAVPAIEVNAPVQFFSVEPMLEKINFYFPDAPNKNRDTWVICGGESGAGCRPFDWDWGRDLRDQCEKANVAFWMKQGGGFPNKREALEFIPPDLQIRELPR
jgi:protein gp37